MKHHDQTLTPTEWRLMECLWEQSPRPGREAVEYLEKALEIRENVLPPEHPYIESTKQSLMGIRFYAMLQEAGISMDDFMRIMEAE